MGDVNLEIKLSNLDERVIKIEESGGGSGGGGVSDYTLLYSGTNTSTTGRNITLPQPISNFKTISFVIYANGIFCWSFPVSIIKEIRNQNQLRCPVWTSSDKFELSISAEYVNDTTLRIWGENYEFKVLGS